MRKSVFSKQVERNLKGIELEKVGKVDEAVVLYEANISEGFEGNHPYDRLAVIYRRQKRLDDEIRVLKKAVDTFGGLLSTPRQDVSPKLARFQKQLEKAISKKADER